MAARYGPRAKAHQAAVNRILAVEHCPHCDCEHEPGATHCKACGRSMDGAAEFADTVPSVRPWDDEPQHPDCPACVVGFGVLLGTLAGRTWLRCRSCGFDFSHTEAL